MDTQALTDKLEELIDNWEDEVTEFKQAGKDYSQDRVGKYFSALANEANLRRRRSAWLVLGVHDKTKAVVGTEYRAKGTGLQKIKHEVNAGTEPGTTFKNVYELAHAEGRVILMEIPAAPNGIPISWKGHYYARAGESLVPLALDKLDRIREGGKTYDWTAELLPDATVRDLDPEAVAFARRGFVEKHANRIPEEEVAEWSDATFLDRVKLSKEGRLTRAAIILLGKWSAGSTYLEGHMGQITWKLTGQEEAYEHFDVPFILATNKLYARIRNVQIRLQPARELVSREIPKYSRAVVMEALHNCIAHQDYQLRSRIIVTEHPTRLEFQSSGSFFAGAPEDYVRRDITPGEYRNPVLTQAMSLLNMIDTMGFGIKRMYKRQAERYLPLPDYSIEPNRVTLTVYGAVIDTNYSELLMERTGRDLVDVLALDRVQKSLPIDADIVRRLRKHSLVEGKGRKLRVSAYVAAATEREAEYVHESLDDFHYAELIYKMICEFPPTPKAKIRELLWGKLPASLSEQQKEDKIKNLLRRLKAEGRIVNTALPPKSAWVAVEQPTRTDPV